MSFIRKSTYFAFMALLAASALLITLLIGVGIYLEQRNVTRELLCSNQGKCIIFETQWNGGLSAVPLSTIYFAKYHLPFIRPSSNYVQFTLDGFPEVSWEGETLLINYRNEGCQIYGQIPEGWSARFQSSEHGDICTDDERLRALTIERFNLAH